jgi:hypothetical protein
MKTTNNLLNYGLLFARYIAFLSIGISAAASAQIGSVVYSSPLVVGNNTTIGTVSCAFDAANIVKGNCSVNVTAANWCVDALKATATAIAPSSARSTSSSSGTVTIPTTCATKASAPFTLTTICTPPQPYKLALLGTAYQKVAACKKPKSDSDSDKDKKENEREGERSKSESAKESKDGKERNDDSNECEDEKSSDKNDDRSRLAMNSRSSDDKKGDKKDDDKPKSKDEKEDEGSGSGSVPRAKPMPFQINGQLPCQVPFPT